MTAAHLRVLDDAIARGWTLTVADGRLCVDGEGERDEYLLAELRDRRDALIAHLACARCADAAFLTAYWGERLCQRCAQSIAAENDRNNSWPEVPWESVNDGISRS